MKSMNLNLNLNAIPATLVAPALELLIKAKEAMDAGVEHYMCLALAEVLNDRNSRPTEQGLACDYLRGYISAHIESVAFLDSWVLKKFEEHEMTAAAHRLYYETEGEGWRYMMRMAWFDKMIETLEHLIELPAPPEVIHVPGV